MTDNNTVNTNQQTTTQPEENGSSGKLFTQDEVNNIVRERLNRAKAAAAEQDSRTVALDKREADLKAKETEMQQREGRAACAEYCKAKGYDESVLDMLDTSNPEKFGETLDKLLTIAEAAYNKKLAAMKVPRFVGPIGDRSSGQPDPIADAFKPKGWN